MDFLDKAVSLIEEIFSERKKPEIRGRQEGPRRPERATVPTGSGYKGPGGQMTGRGMSGELKAPDVPNIPKEPGKKNIITEFDSMEDWMLSMIIVAVMHANPEMSPDEAITEGQQWARKLYLPRMDYLWRKQIIRIDRHGIRAEASKIRREMFKMI